MTRRIARQLAVLALLALPAGCRNFLTGGELSTDPNRVVTATPLLLFESTQPKLWTEMGSDLDRNAVMFMRQMAGAQRQYQSIYQYSVDESTAGGFYASLYGVGALYDFRNIEQMASASGDSLLLGITQVEEAMMMGTGADVFGDIVYSKAFSGPNPALDPQMQVYDSLQALLSRAIVNLSATGPSNAGPGTVDMAYSGSATKWKKLAYTLKARYYMHTAEVRGTPAYQAALAATQNGMQVPSDDYMATYSGASGGQNLWYQFDIVQRSGYIAPDPYYVNFLTNTPDPVFGTPRNDPRVNLYFNADRSDLNNTWIGVQGNGNAPTEYVTAAENLLIGAEAAYKTGNPTMALSLLNQERATYQFPKALAPSGYVVPTYPAGTTGAPLLQAILDEKYIALFQNMEVWNDYKRNCYPNLPLAPGAIQNKIPARLFYDTSIRNTNTSIPAPSQQPIRNANDPANATDPFGNACIGQ
ncbi:MAG TPA: SusD/RagB family nutrient-binding outer membrane lipoprotein [Gemmatimonadaceae bacterium]|nr:SusD/RagB family nutrient-binding outer membrane lipoprotein [Gemmatimonadaceae bacterium]